MNSLSDKPLSASLPAFFRKQGGPFLRELTDHIDRNWIEESSQWPRLLAYDSGNAKSLLKAARQCGWGHLLDLVQPPGEPAYPELLADLPCMLHACTEKWIPFWFKCLFGVRVTAVECKRNDHSLEPTEISRVEIVVESEDHPNADLLIRLLRELVPAHVAVDRACVSFGARI